MPAGRAAKYSVPASAWDIAQRANYEVDEVSTNAKRNGFPIPNCFPISEPSLAPSCTALAEAVISELLTWIQMGCPQWGPAESTGDGERELCGQDEVGVGMKR